MSSHSRKSIRSFKVTIVPTFSAWKTSIKSQSYFKRKRKKWENNRLISFSLHLNTFPDKPLSHCSIKSRKCYRHVDILFAIPPFPVLTFVTFIFKFPNFWRIISAFKMIFVFYFWPFDSNQNEISLYIHHSADKSSRIVWPSWNVKAVAWRIGTNIWCLSPLRANQ